jgi:hypothetical protein
MRIDKARAGQATHCQPAPVKNGTVPKLRTATLEEVKPALIRMDQKYHMVFQRLAAYLESKEKK